MPLKQLQQYFPQLTRLQQEQFAALESCYKDWNEKINVISRKDIEHLYLHHVLHSLSIAKFISINPGSRVLDAGTGGGFPGIPLAIFFPEVQFHLIDATGKKIKVVQSVADSTGLKNVTAQHMRAEQAEGAFDFIVSRAVAPLQTLYGWTKHLLSGKQINEIPNGWLVLKGGDLHAELHDLKRKSLITPVSDYFDEPYFHEKYLLYF